MRTFLTLITLAFLTFSAHAEQDSTTTSNPYTVTIDTTCSSHYWGTIVGGIFYGGGPVNFTTLTLSKDNDWGSTYGFVGMINPLDTLKYDYLGGTEYYAAFGHTFNLWKNDDGIPLMKINAMLLYDSISEIERLNDDLWEQFIRIDFPQVPVVQPFVEFYHWNAQGRNSPPTGHFLKAGFHRQQVLGFNLGEKPAELSIDVLAGWSSQGLFGKNSGLAYYRAIVSTEIQVTKHMKLIPSIVGQLPGGGQGDQAFIDRARLFYNLSLRWTF